MPTTPETSFYCEVQKTQDESIGPISTVVCHGRVVSQSRPSIEGSG